jgi:hypothetical protein
MCRDIPYIRFENASFSTITELLRQLEKFIIR